jgi:hypothetical protein
MLGFRWFKPTWLLRSLKQQKQDERALNMRGGNYNEHFFDAKPETNQNNNDSRDTNKKEDEEQKEEEIL